jgi:hypothetical protein
VARAGDAGDGEAPREEAALPPTLSYTSMTLLERCGYRYYLERVLRMPEQPAEGGSETGGLDARDRGVLVHRLLEMHDFAAGGAPEDGRVATVAAELGIATSADERAEVSALIDGALRAPMAARIASSRRLRREHPFAFGLGEGAPLVNGVFDLLCDEADGTALLVDYKSDRLAPGTETKALVARDYGVQRLLYALAVLREGALVVDVVHWFLERPDEPAVARYTLSERAGLEDQLARRLGALRAQPFAVSAEPHRALCLTCPGRGGLCSWSEEETMREEPAATSN